MTGIRSWRWVASLEAGSITRATSMASRPSASSRRGGKRSAHQAVGLLPGGEARAGRRAPARSRTRSRRCSRCAVRHVRSLVGRNRLPWAAHSSPQTQRPQGETPCTALHAQWALCNECRGGRSSRPTPVEPLPVPLLLPPQLVVEEVRTA